MYISVKLPGREFNEVRETVTQALKEEQFGVITTIDVRATMKEKLDTDFRNYVILGACNPPFAHKALQINDKVGVLLPCNVCIQEWDDHIEVFAMDPSAVMGNAGSDPMSELAETVTLRLRKVLDSLIP